MQSKVTSHAHSYSFACAKRELALFTYTSGVSFNCLENPHFRKFCSHLSASFVPPSAHSLANPLLDEADAELNVWKAPLLQEGLICLCSDGYTDTKQVNLTNMEAYTRLGPVHVKTVQRTAAELRKDADYISGQIIICVSELGGSDKVVGFVSDNERTMRNVWEILEDKLDSFLCVPCCCHVGSLLLKDIAKEYWISQVIDKTKDIVFFLKNHSYPLALLREKKNSIPSLAQKELSFPHKTRFGSNYKMLERAFEFKGSMQQTVVDERFEQCSAFDRTVKTTVLSDHYWAHVRDAVAVMGPTYFFIRKADTNKCEIGDVYLDIRSMANKVAECGTDDAGTAHTLVQERIEGTPRKVAFHSPVHSAAMMLNPKNWDVDFAQLLGDREYARVRTDFVGVLGKVFRTNPEAGMRALLQYDNEYKLKTLGYFASSLVQSSAKFGNAMWWKSNGTAVSELQYCATRILSLKIANSAAERNWGIHGFIHSKSRNRLGFAKTCKLVNVYSNTKLRSRMANAGPIAYNTDDEFRLEDDEEKLTLQQEEEARMEAADNM